MNYQLPETKDEIIRRLEQIILIKTQKISILEKKLNIVTKDNSSILDEFKLVNKKYKKLLAEKRKKVVRKLGRPRKIIRHP